jgi:hypothetical protein
MLPSVPTDAALASLRTRFQAMSQQVTGGLCSISARVHELPEVQRPPLLAVLHNLEGMQLKLRQLVEQGSLGGAASIAARISVLEAAIPAQLDLLGQVSVLADRIGLRVHAAAAKYSHATENRVPGPPPAFLPPPPTAVAHLPQALPHPGPPVPTYVALAPHPGVYHQPPPPGYHMAAAPAWPQFLQRQTRGAEPEEVDYDDRDEADDEPGRRRSRSRRRARDEDSDRRPPWSPLRDISSVGLMLGAVIAGGFSFADRIYRPSGPGDKLALFEQAGREPGVPGPAARSVVGDKFQGRLSEEPGAERSDAPRAAAAADGLAPAQALAPEIEHTLDTPAPAAPAQAMAPPAPRGRSAIPTAPQRPAMPAAGQRPPVKLISKVPEPAAQPASPAPSPKIEQAALVAPPPAAAKPAAQQPAATPEPEPDEGSGGLFVPVLSTHKDAKAAREAFAELQKQHAAVLGAKQSEVQASASEGGAWHRLVVTPAASKEAATEVCNKLRTAGYARCWVKPY